MEKIISVCGPTASGKSALALELCRHFDGELISCDSMQVYKYLDIGTAKPSADEQAEIKHHMIDVFMPWEDCSCGEYAKRARGCIKDVLIRNKMPVLCGGTGLYLNAIVNNLDTCPSKCDEELRRTLLEKDKHELWSMLKEIDPDSAESIHENNVKRVVRAIEIYYTAGITKTELDAKQRASKPEFDVINVILDFEDREHLYGKIDRRCEQMLDGGLIDEIRRLLECGSLIEGSTAYQAIGYKEFISYLRGEVSYDEAVTTFKQATRNYAKRQITWFKKTDGLKFKVDTYSSFEKLRDEVIKQLSSVLTPMEETV